MALVAGLLAVVLPVSLALAGGPAAAAGSARAGSTSSCPWLNQSLPISKRVSLLLAQMTLADKINEVTGAGFSEPYVFYISAIPSLCIPAIGEEDGPVGVGDGLTGVTQLPSAVSLAATFDTALAYQYGKVIGAEEHGKGAMVNLGPTVNIDRDPRWGRSFEAYTEDPFLNASTTVAEIDGVQSQGEMSQVKHFAVYNQETNRNTPADNAIVSTQALHEIYLPAFWAATQLVKATSVMCAFSYINGQAACENQYLLRTTLDQRWAFPGFVTSDYQAMHSTVASAEAGTDQEMPASQYYGPALKAAIQAGQVSMATLNEMVSRILTEMFRFNEFNNPPAGSTSTTQNPCGCYSAVNLSLDGMQLLANPGTPPVSTYSVGVKLVAGQKYTLQLSGGGESANLSWATPSDLAPGIAQAVAAAQAAKTAVVVVSDDTETEAADRPSLNLPSAQNELISAVAAANPYTVVVIDAGAPVVMPWINQVASVVDAWYPGESNGTALAAVLFGQANPGGHLPVTFPVGLSQVPASTPAQFPGVNGQVLYSEGVDVGYRFYDANNETPLFPFGYGLSYTNFRFSGLTVTPQQAQNNVSGPGPTSCHCNGQSANLVTVTARVTNTGRVAGSDAVQLYLDDPAVAGQPPRQLQGYQKVTLQPGQSTTVRFKLNGHELSYWNDSANGWVVPVGQFGVYVGDSSALANLPLHGSFTVTRSIG
jgi:beta-glucosidase